MTTKLIKRRVLAINVDKTRTKQHNPTGYWYILECGHVVFASHSAKSFVDTAIMKMNTTTVPLMKVCRQCMKNKPIEKKVLRGISERLVAKEINPNNFKEIVSLYEKAK